MLSACDLVRFPGDGGPPPKVPEAGLDIPEGAPGPPPPGAPIADPYDVDDDGNIVTDDDAPIAPPTQIDTPPAGTNTPDAPDADITDTATEDTNGTDSDAPDMDAPDTNAPGTDVSDTGTPDPEPPLTTDTAPEVTPDPLPEPEPIVFSYHAPGALLPGTGEGQTAQIVHAPDIVFPIKDAPAYLQSMVFTFGGGVGGGDQCDARNYDYPWRDNFCETRSRDRTSPFCPTNRVHQGQDIRVGTPGDCNTLRSTAADARGLHDVVAVEDGVISHIGSYSVNLRAGGRIYKYMHMNMGRLQVERGQFVSAGDTLGYVSNDFGGTPTTFHLHFEITQNTAEHGWSHVPPYLSLVEAYERRQAGRGDLIDQTNVAVAAAPVVIPEGFEIIE